MKQSYLAISIVILIIMSCDKKTTPPVDYGQGMISFDFNNHDNTDFSPKTGCQIEKKGLTIKEYDPIPSNTTRYIWFHDSIVDGKIPIISSFRYELTTGIKSQFTHHRLITAIDIEFVYSENKNILEKNADGKLTYKNKRDFVNRIKKENWSDKATEEKDPSQLLITFPKDTTYGYFYPLHLASTEGLYYDKESIEITKISYEDRNNTTRIEGTFTLDCKNLFWQQYSTYSYYELINGNFTINF